MAKLNSSERASRSIEDSICVRAIVFNDNLLLVVRRNNHGRTYATLPGGHLEDGESPEDGIIREVQEETSVIIKSDKLLWDQPARTNYSRQLYYLCHFIEGTPQLNPDSEEFAENQLGQNIYQPIFIEYKQIRDELVPSELIPHLDNFFNKTTS